MKRKNCSMCLENYAEVERKQQKWPATPRRVVGVGSPMHASVPDAKSLSEKTPKEFLLIIGTWRTY